MKSKLLVHFLSIQTLHILQVSPWNLGTKYLSGARFTLHPIRVILLFDFHTISCFSALRICFYISQVENLSYSYHLYMSG